jgi:hypothetical protein
MSQPNPPAQNKNWKNTLNGALGFSLAGILAPLLAIALFRLLPLGRLIKSIGQTQALIALLWTVFIVLFVLVVAGAIQGLIIGYTLSRIDPLASQRRYLLAGAVGSGLIFAPLALVFFLLAVLISIFNNNADVSVRSFILFFGLFGVLNGLLFGALFGLIGVGWRHFWRYWLAALGGYTLGGMLLGLSIWLAARADAQDSRLLGILAVIGILVGMPALAGAAMGWTAGWFDRRRQTGRRCRYRWAVLARSPWRSWVTLAVGVSLLATRLTRFLTIKPGSLSNWPRKPLASPGPSRRVWRRPGLCLVRRRAWRSTRPDRPRWPGHRRTGRPVMSTSRWPTWTRLACHWNGRLPSTCPAARRSTR